MDRALTEIEKYRHQLVHRLDVQRGRTGNALRMAEAAGCTYKVLWSWSQTGKNLPTTFHVSRIADHKQVSPAWLAYGLGPRDLVAARKAFDIGKQLESFPELSVLFDALARMDASRRRGLLNALGIQLAESPAPAQHALGQMAEENRIDDPARFKPPEIQSTSRRHELAQYHIQRIGKRQSSARGVPAWLNLAAGPGGPLELTENMIYFRELPDRNGWHSAVIRGESMAPTLLPGDVVLLDELNHGRGLELPALEHGAPKSNFHEICRIIRRDEIYVISIDDEDPTIKRIKYSFENADNWHLIIDADNNAEPGYPYTVPRRKKIVFWARLIGVTPASDYTKALARR